MIERRLLSFGRMGLAAGAILLGAACNEQQNDSSPPSQSIERTGILDERWKDHPAYGDLQRLYPEAFEANMPISEIADIDLPVPVSFVNFTDDSIDYQTLLSTYQIFYSMTNKGTPAVKDLELNGKVFNLMLLTRESYQNVKRRVNVLVPGESVYPRDKSARSGTFQDIENEMQFSYLAAKENNSDGLLAGVSEQATLSLVVEVCNQVVQVGLVDADNNLWVENSMSEVQSAQSLFCTSYGYAVTAGFAGLPYEDYLSVINGARLNEAAIIVMPEVDFANIPRIGKLLVQENSA